MKIKFTNGTEQEYLSAIETEEYYNGASRRTLTFTLPQGTSVDAVNAIVSTESNVQTITLSNGELTNVYDGYVLKLEIGVKPVLSNVETNTYVDTVVLKLGKRTFIEQKLHDLGI